MGLFSFFKGKPKTPEKPAENETQKPAGKKQGKAADSASGNRVVVLALDGFSSGLLNRLMAAGQMPRCAAIRQQGSLVPMVTPFSHDGAVAWAEFMTGMNAGKHGVFGDENLASRSYRTQRVDAAPARCSTLWEILEEHGKRAVVVNAPVSRPAKEATGILVPPTPVAAAAGATPEAFMEAARTSFDEHRKTIANLWDHEAWDLFVAAISETKALHRAFWAASGDPSHPQHGLLMEWYGLVDEFIGEMYERTKSLDGSPAFVLISDHGYTQAKPRVFVNSWLREKGYLGGSPASPEEITDGTAAFALSSGRIYLNTEGKYPRGAVAPGEACDRLRSEIAYGLLDLTVNGEHVIEKIYTQEDLFSGPFSEDAPDLIAVAEPGFELDGALDHEGVTQAGAETGAPSRDDAVFFINRLGIASGRPRMQDMAPTILDLLAIPAKEMDGASLVCVAAVCKKPEPLPEAKALGRPHIA